MEPVIILTLIGAVAAAFFGAKTIGTVDNRVEDRKRGTMKLAIWASNNGLPLLTDLLENYTVNARTEVIGSIRSLIDVLRDADQSKAALDTFLKVQLTKKLSTEEGKKQILTQIEEILDVKIDRDALIKAPTSLGPTDEEFDA